MSLSRTKASLQGKMLDAQSLQSVTIDYLRFPMALAVVFIHSKGEPTIALPDYAHFAGTDFFNLLRIVMSNVLTSVAVPTFFLISGFLYFLNVPVLTQSVYKRKTRSRWHTLILPYILWNIIALVYLTLVAMARGYMSTHSLDFSILWQHMQGMHWLWDIFTWGDDHTNWLGYAVPATRPINPPLWFLRDLIVVQLLSPVVWWWVKHTHAWGVALLALCYVSGVFPLINGLGVQAVFWFSMGTWLSISGKNLVNAVRRVEWPAYAFTLILLPFMVRYNGMNTATGFMLEPFFELSGTISAFCIASRMVQRGARPNSLLVKSCFFIYAIHTMLVNGVTYNLLNHLLRTDAWWAQSLKYVVAPFLTIAICLGLYLLAQRFFPRITGWLTGDRR